MRPGQALNLDREAFLSRYWQQKPLLVRQAIPNFKPPISRHELAGLAFEDDVESRIIEHSDGQWLLSHGPFAESDYKKAVPWTLLVQAVDHFIGGVAELRQLVDFIPQWRVDDVMVSYATDGGSVGPHYDNYDVFLLQGEGQRLWQTGQLCDADTPLLPHDELRILKHFDSKAQYLLEPGDMLYLPPGVAHWGIAQGECTTFSIGFRAPRVNDMLSRFVDGLLAELEPEQFYRDARLETVTRPGEIRPRDLERVQAQLEAALDQASDYDWFGELVTEPRYLQTMLDEDPPAGVSQLDGPGKTATLSPAAKLAWRQEADGIVVYANGDSRRYSRSQLDLVIALCTNWSLDESTLDAALTDKESRALLAYLLEAGCIDVE